MSISEEILRKDEKAIMRLRALYEQYGYKKYKMNKFEEYDFYVENKSFLKSENIITFNDLSGKLLALKPDVTLSIVKNTNGIDKLYYNESVYRVENGEYRESMQVGLEYIGDIDLYSLSEVIGLAQKSLEIISDKHILDISHIGIVAGLLDVTGLSHIKKEQISKCISEKNAHQIKKICDDNEVCADISDKIIALASIYGPFDKALEAAKSLVVNETTKNAVDELESLYCILKATGSDKNINLDFSIINDMNYYNGIIFQGFTEGIFSVVLSGGRYDKLLHKLGKGSGAIGFAVHVDLLERYDAYEKPYDTDILIIYNDNADYSILALEVKKLTDNNESVRVQKGNAGKIKAKKTFIFDGRGLREN